MNQPSDFKRASAEATEPSGLKRALGVAGKIMGWSVTAAVVGTGGILALSTLSSLAGIAVSGGPATMIVSAGAAILGCAAFAAVKNFYKARGAARERADEIDLKQRIAENGGKPFYGTEPRGIKTRGYFPGPGR